MAICRRWRCLGSFQSCQNTDWCWTGFHLRPGKLACYLHCGFYSAIRGHDPGPVSSWWSTGAWGDHATPGWNVGCRPYQHWIDHLSFSFVALVDNAPSWIINANGWWWNTSNIMGWSKWQKSANTGISNHWGSSIDLPLLFAFHYLCLQFCIYALYGCHFDLLPPCWYLPDDV